MTFPVFTASALIPRATMPDVGRAPAGLTMPPKLANRPTPLTDHFFDAALADTICADASSCSSTTPMRFSFIAAPLPPVDTMRVVAVCGSAARVEFALASIVTFVSPSALSDPTWHALLVSDFRAPATRISMISPSE